MRFCELENMGIRMVGFSGMTLNKRCGKFLLSNSLRN